MKRLPKETREEIKAHALKKAPRECCGLLISNKNKFDLKVYQCKNLAESKEGFFTIDPRDYVRATRYGKIEATYHSHTNENQEFSQADKENSKKHELNYVLYNTQFDSFHLFDYKRNGVSNLSKEFKWGVSDCIILVKDYLKENLNIETLIPEKFQARDALWNEKHPTLIEEVLQVNNKFKKVYPSGRNEFLKNDILCFSIFKSKFVKTYDHWAIYLGNGQIYHHPANRYPTTEDFGAFYSSKLMDVYRYVK
jgi:proteasome lid subunit RPN8/RPN11